MVLVLNNNQYVLSSYDDNSNLLVLGRKYYLLQDLKYGQLKISRIQRPAEHGNRIEKGNYWLFNVVGHANFTPGVHLSLVSESCQWKAYITEGSFPAKTGDSCLLMPTSERIARPPKNNLKTAVAS